MAIIIIKEVKMSSKSLVAKIKKIDEKAVMPTRAHPSDSGYDLTLIGVDKIKGDTIFFKTGLQVKPPAGHYFEVYPRSSIAPMPLMLANSVGIIDSNYRGELIVAIRVLHGEMGAANERDVYPSGMIYALEARPTSMMEVANLILGKKPKIAQMILRKRIDCLFEEATDLEETDRNTGGFGSTG